MNGDPDGLGYFNRIGIVGDLAYWITDDLHCYLIPGGIIPVVPK